MATNGTISQDVLKAIEVHGLPASVAGVRPGPDDMLTMTELAARLKQAMRTVERWHRSGVVLGIKVDGRVRSVGFLASDVDALIATRMLRPAD